ncbi:MAG: RNA methyltransferase [Bacteroidia bacterium]|nr:RNA methyltransferase [Bacteroidia bacterium]
MDNQLKAELTEYLCTFISDKRRQRFDEVINNRTNHIRVVLEDVYQAHNASAVLRSCDCFGIQHVHFIENRNVLKISDDVAMGSSNWLTVHRHRHTQNNSEQTLLALKNQGYKIVATTPHEKSLTIDKLPVDGKIALVFGTEIDGISEKVYANADAFVKIPMFGFTESFNISVSAALCMYELTKRSREVVPDYFLSEQEKLDIYYDWLRTSIDKGDALVKNYLDKK